MAISVNNNDDAILYGLVKAFNDLHYKTTVLQADGYTTATHRDITSVTSGDFRDPSFVALEISVADASGLASSIALANAVKGALNLHLPDAECSSKTRFS